MKNTPEFTRLIERAISQSIRLIDDAKQGIDPQPAFEETLGIIYEFWDIHFDRSENWVDLLNFITLTLDRFDGCPVEMVHAIAIHNLIANYLTKSVTKSDIFDAIYYMKSCDLDPFGVQLRQEQES